jgi:hypothetical protein
MDRMETLGLSSPRQKEDNFFQRLFWPTIHNQYDVDLLGAQGFWIAAAVGLVSGIVLTISGQLLIGLVVAFVFIAGACGVRERSIAASILIFVLYLLDVMSRYILTPTQAGSPVVAFIAIMLLLANVRATIISETWFRAAEGQGDHDLPERITSSFSDKLVNQAPIVIWPKIKYPFFVIAVILIFLTATGIVFGRHAARPVQNSSQPGTSGELPVAPAN